MSSAFDVTPISSSGQNVIQISSELPAPRRSPRCWRSASSQALAQSDDVDPEMRIQQLENQLRQLTGQNEELQYHNRQLEERLRVLQGGAQAAPAVSPRSPSPTSPPCRRCSPTPPIGSRRPSRAMSRRLPLRRRSCRNRQVAGRAVAAAMPSIPARIRTRPARRARSAAASCRSRPRRRSARPAGATPGEPLDLANTGGARNPAAALPPPPRNANAPAR